MVILESEKSTESIPVPLKAMDCNTVKEELKIRFTLNAEQPSNAELFIVETFLKFILAIPVQLLNALAPMVVVLLKSTEVMFVHPSNAFVPIVSTVFGIVKLAKRDEQFLNNELEIVVEENKLKLDKVVKLEQLKNVFAPIVVRVDEKTKVPVKFVQPWNVPFTVVRLVAADISRVVKLVHEENELWILVIFEVSVRDVIPVL